MLRGRLHIHDRLGGCVRVFRSLALGLLVLLVSGGGALWAEGAETISVTGRLTEVSKLPDPKTSPYDDCLQIVEMTPLSAPPEAGLPDVILVGWLGFEDRELTAASRAAPGAEVTVRLIPFAEAPKELRTMQRADTVTAFGAPLFYAEEVRIVSLPADAPGAPDIPTTKPAPAAPLKYTQSAEGRAPTAFAEARRAVIQADRERIARVLAEHGGDWDAWSAKLGPFYRDLRAQSIKSGGGMREGRDFFARTYDHRFQELMATPEEAPALDMILALDRALAERGIDLMVVPYPFKEEITADRFSKLAPPDGLLSPQRLRFIDWLLAHDVEIIDLAPELKEAEKGSTAEWLYYDFEELHPARDGIEIAADVIASRLDRYGLDEEWDELSQRDVTFTMPGSFRKRYPMMPEQAVYPARQVITAEGTILPKETPDSPVLLVGDSFTRAPGLYDVFGASLREHLAYQSGVLARDLGVAASAAQTMRNLRREGADILEGVKVCVFVFAQYPLFVEKEDLDDPSYQWEIVPLP